MHKTHNLLGVDTTSGAWREVLGWAQRQVEIHTLTALSLGASSEERRDAAVRIDELRALMEAPERTRRLSEQRHEFPIDTY
jgi:hypothetical protein